MDTDTTGTKVLHVSAFDVVGGAARAAYRLHQGLQGLGVNSQMLVQFKASDDHTVTVSEGKLATRVRSFLDATALKRSSKAQQLFSPQWFPDALVPRVAQLCPDIIDLHWLCNGFVRIETLARFKKPLVWTLHDMWAFTGGCHYSYGCERYHQSCGSCPQLDNASGKVRDLSHWVWQRKAKAWKELNLTIITPSLWLAERARASSIFRDLRVEVIPYGIDTRGYKPISQPVARDILNLQQNKRFILFVASNAGDPRKGLHFLRAALQKLHQSGSQNDVELLVLGESSVENQPNLGFKAHYLGKLSDDISLAIIYSAADIYVAPSVQDNLPNTVMESLACGIPCVAFDIGGMPDMIDHQQNGYLARPFDVEDLAQGIAWLLEDQNRYQQLRHYARKTIEQRFTLELQARRYLSIYDEILDKTIR